MLTQLLGIKGTWKEVSNSARTTAGLQGVDVEPTSHWKRKILLAEHSMIRKLHICWKWFDIPSWVSTHFVRHKFGIEHFVKSNRPDRTGEERKEITDHECEANVQAVINISRKRLCNKASEETREAWQHVLAKIFIEADQREIANVCVRDCVYRGWCYEYNSCGYHLTKEYQDELNDYRININGWRRS